MPAVGREIFDADRHAVQQADFVASHHGAFRALRRGHRRFGRERADRVDLRIEPLNCCKTAAQQLDRADRFAANEARELRCGLPVQFIGKAHRVVSLIDMSGHEVLSCARRLISSMTMLLSFSLSPWRIHASSTAAWTFQKLRPFGVHHLRSGCRGARELKKCRSVETKP